MEGEEKGRDQSKDDIIQIFKDFMMRIVEFEELVSGGGKLLVGFQQALGIVRQPPIDKTSKRVERIIKTRGSKRLLSYIEAGCANTHDRVQNMSKLDACHQGLQDHIKKAEDTVNELEHLLKDTVSCLQAANSNVDNPYDGSDSVDDTMDDIEEVSSASDLSKHDVNDYAIMMAIIYCMVKKDFDMQERIVNSLSFKSSNGELETYSQMWSLRPFIDDDMMSQAWNLVPQI